MIHIVNGDHWADVLRDCEPLRGEVFVWREMVDFGPFSPDWDETEQAGARATYFEERLGIPAGQMKMVLTYQEQRLKRLPSTSRIVLWFKPNRHDQLMLLYLLFRIRNLDHSRLELVTIPEDLTLANASPLAVERIFNERLPLGVEHLEEGAEAWQDYISPVPRGMVERASWENLLFPYLGEAFQMNMEYFPSQQNGLNAVEELSLTLIRNGVDTFQNLFGEVAAARPGDGLNAVHFAAIINELGSANGALLDTVDGLSGKEVLGENDRLQLTPLGKRILEGETDRIRTTGIDWWVGGVHLAEDRWRRDQDGCLVEQQV
ncbi:DUF1835 domain-containing protein [Salinithrix halophila]|uniref:DUF1835 domain-containing protein n=1 Tax=Salinithrix halophila TaxID=1485204 RepID=A0ABV8JIE5_9BACL